MSVLDRAEQDKIMDVLWRHNRRLREELLYQWQYNHAEQCRIEWPHPGKDCRWPVPEILEDEPTAP
jgi:hypothetical protein